MANQNAQQASQAVQPAVTDGKAANQPAQNILQDVCVIEGQKAENTHMLERPPLGETREVTLEQGQNYIFGFDKSVATSFVEKDGDLTITFNCGGKLVLKHYSDVTHGDDVSTFAFSDIIPQSQLSSLIKHVDTTANNNDQDPDNTAKHEKHAKADNGVNVANIEPAAGDDNSKNAKQLAQIEPAAGGNGGGAGGHGYGFNSSYSTTPVGPLNPVGPLGATQLQYGANFRQPNPLIGQDDSPLMIGPDAKIIDETNLGPIVVGGNVNVDYGNDGFGSLGPNGNFFSGGSETAGNLTSHGVDVIVTPTADGYIGVANGVTVFTLTISNSESGAYEFTLFQPLDHADGTDPNDQITLTFGVTATDGDGDPVSTSLTIIVQDDVPTIAGDGVKSVDEANLGPVVVHGDLVENFGHDGAGDIHPNGVTSVTGDVNGGVLTSNGHTVTIAQTPDGYVGTANGADVFTITINPNTGAYTFTLIGALDHSVGGDTITLNFGAEIVDYDGDTADTNITINVIDDVPHITDNDHPTVGHGLENIDETNLGPIVVNGAVAVDFGADTPGTFGGNGPVTATGSMTAGHLTSHGVDVVITQTPTGYVGTAGGANIFTMTINNDGTYSFALNGQLDHADGTNPNDIITLTFGVKVTDHDGDSATGNIIINIADDVPTIASDGLKVISEHDAQPTVVHGDLVENFGHDGQGNIHTTGTHSETGDLAGGVLSSGGVPVVITSTPTGYTGTANGVTVFTLTIDNQATGAYTFTLDKPLDHSVGGNQITLNFGAEIVDYDGDTAQTNISIKITDDVPHINDDNPGIGHGLETVDETNLGPITVGGVITYSYGNDGPGHFGIDGSFTAGGSLAGGNLTSHGTTVDVTPTADGYVGKAGAETIFSITVNADGTYSFTQFGVLDHADKTDPNDVITLQFGVSVSDADGDSDTGSITIRVLDDGPVAHDDHNTFDHDLGQATGNVITGLNGGPGAADLISHDTYTSGTPNHVTQISFGGTTVNVPAVGTATIDGDYGTLKIAADGSYTYTEHTPVVGDAKHFAGGPTTFPSGVEGQALSPSEQQALGVAHGDLDAGEGDKVTVSFVSEGAGYSNTLGGFTVAADGTLKAAYVMIPDGNNPGGAAASFTAGEDTHSIGFFLIADGYTANGGYAGIDLNTGELNFVYDQGLPTEREAKITDDGSHVSLVYTNGGVDTVLQGPLYFTTERGGSESLNTDHSVRIVSDLANEGNDTILRIGFEDLPQLGDKDYNDMVFDVTIKTATDDCGTDKFTYTLTDGDGDTSQANLTLECQPDDHPVVVPPAKEVVDESDLGPIVHNGTIHADFFGDTPGAITADGSFTSSGSKLGGNLTSHGVPVTVTHTDAGYIGTANGNEIFKVTIDPNTGNYSFTLEGVLDHADGANPNDVITLQFGVKATDSDGDSASTVITVDILDDAPVAHDDGNFTDGNVVGGNVLTNDNAGHDGLGAVVAIIFNGTTTNVAQGAAVDINGAHGVLHIASNGTYTYTANNGTQGTDVFTYKMDDYDNDTSTAKLTIQVDNDDCPIIIKPAAQVVDETDLNPTVVKTGHVDANYFNDGPGAVTTDGTFTSGGSKLGGNLTSHGVPVTVTHTDTGYVGTANGNEVFKITIAANGDYNFTLEGVLDHADGTNPNDVITLNFGVKATDADGDHANSSITINVLDDAPVAHDDGNFTDGNAINGNVLANDNAGHDGLGKVLSVVFGGTTFVVPNVGQATVNGDHGMLKISANGDYTYTPKAGTDGTDTFTYKMEDYDHDTSTAKLAIQVNNDDCPIIIKPATEIVDETNLNPTVVKTGHVDANYFGDGPGAITTDGAFSSNGSKLGGNLTSHGVPVTVTHTDTGYVGTANGNEIFKITVAPNGDYTFTLEGVLDHADASNPNDAINLNFGVKATDADGDHANTSITVTVLDDAPVAHNDHNTQGGIANGNVISGLNGGAGAADMLSHDVNNTVSKISFGGTTVNVPTAGTATINGDHGVLKIAADGTYTYTPNGSGMGGGAGDAKHFHSDGESFPDMHESEPLDANEQHALGIKAGNFDISGGDHVGVTFVSEQAGYSNTLGVFTVATDGTLQAGSVLIPNSDGVAAGANYNFDAHAGAQELGFFVIADGQNVNGGYSGLDFTHGQINLVFDYGLSTERAANINDDGSHIKVVFTDNGHDTVLNGPTYFTTERGGTENLNPDDSVRVVSAIPHGDDTVLRVGFEDLPCLGDKDYNDVVFDVKISTPDCGCDTDQFTYTLADGDHDTSTATLDFVCTPDTNVGITVNNGVDKICIKEDSSGTVVPVSAMYTGGDGDEVLTLKVTGIDTHWTVTAAGWTNQGGGVYTLTLPAGQTHYDGNFTFKPPHNSDVDMTGLHFTATVSDPDTGGSKTASDDFTVQVDAVVDQPVVDVPATIAQQDWYYYHQGYTMPLNISAHVTDTDGSEVITKIQIDLNQTLAHPVAPYDSLDDMGIGLNKGTEVSPGIWEIAVNAGDTAAALNGLKLVIPNNMDYTNIHNSHIGGNENVNIIVKTFVHETVTANNPLNGECDFTDNDTCVIKSICLTFRITPLVLDLNHNGIELVGADAGVHFDMNNNGTLDKTSWVNGHDGMLAIDHNHDGAITNQSELFGNDDTHSNGFDNLAQYDTNHDGKINASDDVFSSLLVWQDTNQDGVSQSGELHTLHDLGISSINLGATETSTLVGDAEITQTSTFDYADGTHGQIVDASFNVTDGDAIGKGVTFDGTDGHDAIYGTGNNDIFVHGLGNDVIYGGEGNDVFQYNSADGSVDTIHDFHAGDILDLSGLVHGSDAVQDSINNFVFKTEVDGNTVVSVDVTGSGDAAHATAIAVLDGVTGLDLNQIVHLNQTTV